MLRNPLSFSIHLVLSTNIDPIYSMLEWEFDERLVRRDGGVVVPSAFLLISFFHQGSAEETCVWDSLITIVLSFDFPFYFIFLDGEVIFGLFVCVCRRQLVRWA
jgi:hypothetical protein